MSLQRSWEYHISHPASNFLYGEQNVDDTIFVKNEREVPVVLIFGWAGCLNKFLKSYSKIYVDRGLATITYITDVKYLFYHSNNMLKIGEEMVKPLENKNLQNRPIICHVFSNGGSYQYEVFLRALKKGPGISSVKGVIFDSTPTKRHPISLYNAVRNTVQSEHFKIPVSVALTTYCMIKRSIEMKYAKIQKKDCIQMNPFDNLKNEESRWPQHFIYSTTDQVVRYKDVETFASHRKSLGVDVTLKRYENSMHVQHYLKNKASYVRSIVKFVNKCLKR